MDHAEPKTRQEKKGKGKEKQVFNQKTIRLKEAMLEKRRGAPAASAAKPKK